MQKRDVEMDVVTHSRKIRRVGYAYNKGQRSFGGLCDQETERKASTKRQYNSETHSILLLGLDNFHSGMY